MNSDYVSFILLANFPLLLYDIEISEISSPSLAREDFMSREKLES